MRVRGQDGKRERIQEREREREREIMQKQRQGQFYWGPIYLINRGFNIVT